MHVTQRFIEQKDLFVNLPTGYGKSLMFQIAQFVASFVLREQLESPITIIISHKSWSVSIFLLLLTRDSTYFILHSLL